MQGWKRFGVVFLAAGLPACGGSSSVTQPCPGGTTGTPPNCVATPPPCTTTNVDRDTEALTSLTLLYNDVSVPDTGRLDITLDWTFATSPIGFYMVPANTCTVEEFNARSCNFVVRSEPSTIKPRKISQPNFTAGNYRWIIANFAKVDESISLLIVLSKGTCPALTSTSVDASALDEDGLPPMQRAVKR